MRIIGFGLIAGGIMFLIGGLFHLLVPALFPHIKDDYVNRALFRPWEGWTQRYMVIHPFLLGVLFAAAYSLLVGLSGESRALRGMSGGVLYGLGLSLLGSLPVFALSFVSFQVSGRVVATWAVQNVAQYAIAGAVLGAWLRR